MKLDIEASIKHAAQCIEQWEHHDKFRVIPEEGADEEPPEITAYKALLLLHAIHEQVPFFQTAATCPECCEEHPTYWEIESYAIDCDCGCRFEVQRHMTSIPYGVMK